MSKKLENLGQNSLLKILLDEKYILYYLHGFSVSGYLYGTLFTSEEELFKNHELVKTNGNTNSLIIMEILSQRRGTTVELYDSEYITELLKSYNITEKEIRNILKNARYEIILETNKKPIKYRTFEYSLLPAINENKIKIYEDYMNQGFGEYEGDTKYIDEEEDGLAARGCGEYMWIKNTDYNKLMKLKNKIKNQEIQTS